MQAYVTQLDAQACFRFTTVKQSNEISQYCNAVLWLYVCELELKRSTTAYFVLSSKQLSFMSGVWYAISSPRQVATLTRSITKRDMILVLATNEQN